MCQDVRGRYLSGGTFKEITTALTTAQAGPVPGQSLPHDKSTDIFNTIEWLLKNIPRNNGRVGILGISHPGFYASATLPNAHPALKALSPQAPVIDGFLGDDTQHKDAFFLLGNSEFPNHFDVPRPTPVAEYKPLFAFAPTDAETFFLGLGTLKNANSPNHFNNRVWDEYGSAGPTRATTTCGCYSNAAGTPTKNFSKSVVMPRWEPHDDRLGKIQRTYFRQRPGEKSCARS